jgi:hypothetical protein
MQNKTDEKCEMYNIKDDEVYYYDEKITLEEVVSHLNYFIGKGYNSSYKDMLEEIKELKTEDTRLCNVISNLYNEIAGYNKKIEKQERVISTQQDIINNLIELIGLIL